MILKYWKNLRIFYLSTSSCWTRSIVPNSSLSSKCPCTATRVESSSEISRGIAESIQQQFSESLEASNNVASVGDYYMLKCTQSPSIICECGFLSNARDEQLLLEPKYQEKIVDCIFKGIINFLNISWYFVDIFNKTAIFCKIRRFFVAYFFDYLITKNRFTPTIESLYNISNYL